MYMTDLLSQGSGPFLRPMVELSTKTDLFLPLELPTLLLYTGKRRAGLLVPIISG